MTSIFVFGLLFASVGLDLPWQELSLTIFPDPGVSSDVSTICRVHVDNHGRHTWSGRHVSFEAEALDGDQVVERARGRFGLTLGPHESLETLIGFSGRFTRFRVRLITKEAPDPSPSRRGSRSKGSARRKHRTR
jgi:hypothetical protein